MPKTKLRKNISSWTARDIPRDSRVLLRIDANVPMNDGRVSIHGRHRLKSILPEIQRLRSRGARIVLIAHLGDPKGKAVKSLSLAPVARALAHAIDHPVRFVPHVTGDDLARVIDRMAPGSIVMLENLRFDKGEEKNSADFAKRLAGLGDVYVNNAFSVCHRKHASIVAITSYLPSFAGELVVREVKALSAAPKHPFVLILGGMKIATKIPLIKHLGAHANAILIGGATALTMLKADVGSLPVDVPEFTQAKDVASAKAIAKKFGKKMYLPCDLVVTKNSVPDVGPATIESFCGAIAKAKHIVWNGPMGIPKREDGFIGTLAIAKAIAKNTKATSIVGGGETVECLEEFDLTDSFTHVSTGGGAMLSFLGGEAMPGLDVLVK